MLLDIKLIKPSSMFCNESAAATVATWLHRNYEMIYCRMWGFDFLAEAADAPGMIGKRIGYGFTENDMIELLERYHGIGIQVQPAAQVDQLIDQIISVLNKGMPVAISMNDRYFPWLNRDPNSEIYGFILIVGYEKDTFYCLDVHNTTIFFDIHQGTADIKLLPYDNLRNFKPDPNGNPILLIQFVVVGDETQNVTLDDFLVNIKKSAQKWPEAFHAMRSFAESIKTNLDLHLERGGIDNVYDIPLLHNIMQVSRARKLLSSTLNYIWRKTGHYLAYNLALEFLWLGGEWKTIWFMLNKAYMVPDQSLVKVQKLQQRMAAKVNEIAQNEESLITKISNDNFGKTDGKFIGYIEMKGLGGQVNTDNIVFVDIDGYLNNKGIASDESNIEGADLTGQREFLLREGFPADNIITANGMSFRLSSHTVYDNFSCRNQLIKLPQGKYKRIMFFGCTEWGEALEWFKIYYRDGHIENTLFYMPDWFDNGAIDVTRVKAQIVGLIDKKHTRREGSIFGVSYQLEETEIDQIQLPEIENVHIFAISLEKLSS